MRYPRARKSKPAFATLETEIAGIGPDIVDGFQVYFWKSVPDAGAERTGRSVKEKSASLGQAQLDGEAGAAETRIATQRRLGSVAVIVAHADIASPGGFYEDHAVGPNAGAPAGKRLNQVRRLELGISVSRIEVENDEIIS
jgi:hypothetical protein